MLSFDHPQMCTKCQGYMTMPFSWNSTVGPRMCTCPKETSLAWECPRCKKINAPWNKSCDCTPPHNSFPFGGPIECKVPISSVQPFNPKGPSPFPKRYNSDGSECNEV
jgi:hypothetical protein